MPGILKEQTPSKKRKRVEVAENGDRVRTKSKTVVANRYVTQIAESEAAVSSGKYNDIATNLLPAAKKEVGTGLLQSQAVVALCRVFCRLLVEGQLIKSNASSEGELKVINWLRGRYEEYRDLLLDVLLDEKQDAQVLALNLCMLLVKEEVSNASSGAESVWKTGLFSKTLDAVLSSTSNMVCQELVERYLQQYDDLRHYAFMAISQLLNSAKEGSDRRRQLRTNAVLIMSTVEVVASGSAKLDSLFCEASEKSKLIQSTAHRKQAQQAWLALVCSGLEKDQRKIVLGMMTSKIVPWFQNVELLMDFLTDSYNEGGATSLLALSGLFYLISEKNLSTLR